MLADYHVIVLCGFMGCGKTTVGKALARRLGWEFIDMDSWIEQQAGASVSEIFEIRGEPAFRALEREACRTLAQRSRCVIASGGGALTFAENVQTFRAAQCPIVLLDVPLDVILLRLRSDTTRPLLQRPDKAQAARRLYDARLPLYRAAASLTIAGGNSPAQTARRIAEELQARAALFCSEAEVR